LRPIRPITPTSIDRNIARDEHCPACTSIIHAFVTPSATSTLKFLKFNSLIGCLGIMRGVLRRPLRHLQSHPHPPEPRLEVTNTCDRPFSTCLAFSLFS